MRRVVINLASRPFRNNVLHWAALTIGITLLSAATWTNIRLYSETRDRSIALEEKLASRRESFLHLNREVDRMTAEVSRVDLVALNERTAFANSIILSRLFSWTTLFDRLEELLPETARLRSVRPNITKDGIEVAVDGLARDYGAILRFEEALLDSKYFAFVYPLQEIARENQGEIQFNIVFGYVPGGRALPEETAAVGGTQAAAAEPPEGAVADEVPAVEDASGDGSDEPAEDVESDAGDEDGGEETP